MFYPYLKKDALREGNLGDDQEQVQVTIPAKVRRNLGVSTSDQIIFVLRPDGSAALKTPKHKDISSLSGAAGRLSEPRTWEEMRQIAYEDRLMEKYAKRT